MTDKNFKSVPFVTEIMMARHPKLSEPDTEGEYADGKYKTEATADQNYTERFTAEIQAVIDQHFAGKKNIHVPWKETNEGETAFIFKSPKKQPILTDAKGNTLSVGITIRGGSLIRITGVLAAWERGAKRGVSLWPDAVRVLHLAEGMNPLSAFGPAEDGFDVAGYDARCCHPECPFNRRDL
ncbi:MULTISPECIES: hypothetical protein [Bradyrhizobium]|uniref:hypothetical protein n=1 Tax=Bradyrhizobium TaxID=374 RepID=UPI001EDBE5E0|nr:hypothetical protein [Bradyrhizobium zhengyangense]MCG2642433.1 hypothetical protein [Bradyrhizobium zhengyangense]